MINIENLDPINFFSNCLFSRNQLLDIVNNGDSQLFEENGDILLFVNTEYGFQQLYFWLQKSNRQNVPNNCFYKQKIVIEFLTLENKIEDNIDINYWLKLKQFYNFRNYTRMFQVGRPLISDLDSSIIETPVEDDLYEIKRILEQNFDIYSERIPEINELKKLANSTYLIRQMNEIAALLVSEKKGKTEELRYWLVLPKFRSMGYGGILMKYFLNLNNDTLRYTLWVDIKNQNAIEKYEHYGFKRDKIINKIILNEVIMKEKILKILNDTRPEFNFSDPNIQFIDSGYLDSFDIVTIVADIENSFNVKIQGSLILPENFQTVDSITNLIQKSTNAS